MFSSLLLPFFWGGGDLRGSAATRPWGDKELYLKLFKAMVVACSAVDLHRISELLARSLWFRVDAFFS